MTPGGVVLASADSGSGGETGDFLSLSGGVITGPLTVTGNTTLGKLSAAGIDGTPIGATTPSTGAFTTVTASGIGTFSSVVATSSSEVSTLVQLTTTSRYIGNYRHTFNTPSWTGGGPLQGFTWALNLVCNSSGTAFRRSTTISFGPDPSYGTNVAYMIIERYQNKLVFAGVDSSGTETDLLTLRTAPDALLATLSAPVSMTSTLAVTGASTLTGALVANGAVSGTGMTNRFATPGPIGSTTASTGAFSTLTTSGATTHNAAVALNSGVSTLSPGAAKTGASYSVSANDTSLILAPTGTFTLTLPAASSSGGRLLFLKLTAAFAVNSASANVVPLAGGAATTAIMSATAGSFCQLQSDGTNWQIMNANTQVAALNATVTALTAVVNANALLHNVKVSTVGATLNNAVANGAVLRFDTVTADSDGYAPTGAPFDHVTIPTKLGGMYVLTGWSSSSGTQSTTLGMGILVNGSSAYSATNQSISGPGSVNYTLDNDAVEILQLNDGDIVQLINNSVSSGTNMFTSVEMSLIRIGPGATA